MNVIFGSVAQMLSPAALSGLMGASIESVERIPMEVVHFSGNTLEQVRGLCDGRPISFVLKRFSQERDWVMRLTRDTQVREVALYRTGLYAGMPAGVWQPTLAAARDGSSWAALMEDVTDWMSRPETITEPELNAHLSHLAQIHAHFMNDTSVLDQEIGLSSLEDFLTILSPTTIHHEMAAGQAAPVFGMAAKGWQAFERLVNPDVVGLVRRAQAYLEPLLAELQAMPCTLLHGDYKLANLGYRPGLPEPRTIVLDWQDASYGPPLLDLAYWLAVNPACFPGFQKDAALARYRKALADGGLTFTNAVWEHDLALCLLAGGGLRLFWQMALREERAQSDDSIGNDLAAGDLNWWSEKVARAGQWLN